MPGKTPPNRKTGMVVAKPTREELLASSQQLNRVGTEFLKADIATGRTFVEAALSSDDPEKKRRNQKSARKAYDTVVRMLKKITPNDADAQELNAGLQRLKADLVELGEVF
jgi:hypothetical protein